MSIGLLHACLRFGYDAFDPPGITDTSANTGGLGGTPYSSWGAMAGGPVGGSTGAVTNAGTGAMGTPGSAGAAPMASGSTRGNGGANGGTDSVSSTSAGTSSAAIANGGTSDGGSAGMSGGTASADGGTAGDANAGGNAAISGGTSAVASDTSVGGYDGTAGAAGTVTTGSALGGTSTVASNEGGASAAGRAGSSVGGSNGGAAGNTGGTPSTPATFSDCCRYANIVIIEGTSTNDTILSVNLAGILANACGTAPAVRQVSQDAAGVLDTSGRPLIGSSELALMSGGFVTQRALAYLDQNDTPAYASLTVKNNHYTILTRAGNQIASIPNKNFTSSYDVAVLTVTYEALSQTFVLDVHGFNSVGTAVGVFYFASTIAPNLKTDAKHFYVIEWTDVDGDQTPSAGDAYNLLASG